MRRRVLSALLVLGVWAVCAPAWAQQGSFYQQLTVGTTATGLTNAAGLTFCRSTLETQQIRVLFNGGTPTATVGQPMNVGDQLVLNNARDIQTFSAISTSTVTSGVLNLTCGTGNVPAPSFVSPSPTVAAATALTAVTPAPVQQSATDLRGCMTANATAAVNTQATLTLTPPNGQSVYLCGLDITVSQNGTASVNTNLTFTSTNLGGWLWKYSMPATVNTSLLTSVILAKGTAIKGAVPGTAVTIVSPSGVTNTAFSITGYYRFAQ